MLFKELKKLSVLQVAVLLLAAAFAFVVVACPGDDLGGTQTGGTQTEGEEVVGDTIINYTSGDDALDWGVDTLANVLTLGLTPGNDTTAVNLNWYSSGAQASKVTKVRFIRGTLAAGAELIEQEGTVIAASTGNTAHKATVTGLKPGSSYQYAVSSDGTNWSTAYNFEVPAANAAFKFAVVADPQLTTGNVDSNSRYPASTVTTATGWLETMQKIVAANVSFIASCGDQVDAGAGNETEYTNFFAPPGLRSLPLSPVSGNHDNHLHYNYHFNWPGQTTQTTTTEGRNYYYRYNNVLFVVLDTAPYPVAYNASASSSSAAAPSINAFRTTIQAAKAAHAGKYDWLIVQHHKSTASVAVHLADRDIQSYVEAGFETLMSEENVDFVLAGHDHVYARSYPLQGMDNGKVSVPDKTNGTSQTYTNPGKPIYLTFTTASGLKYYPIAADPYFAYTTASATKLYVQNNTEYPYLGEVTDANGTSSTKKGSTDWIAGNLPVSNAAYVQPWIPSYGIVAVNGKTIKFSTYAIKTTSGVQTEGTTTPYSFNENDPYDWVEVTKTP